MRLHSSMHVPSRAIKDLCPQNGKFWDTLMKDGEPENVYHFLTHEIRFVNYFISDYAKVLCEDMQKQFKSNFMDTVAMMHTFYKTVLMKTMQFGKKFINE